MLLPKGDLAAFWREALIATDGLKKPALLKQQFDCKKFGESLVLEILSKLTRSDQFHAKVPVRLSIARDKADIHRFTLKEKPLPSESIERWSDRRFGAKQFCIVINHAGRCSERFSRAIAELFSPFLPCLEEINLKNPLLEPGIFLGNYDSTPFGIHMDNPERKSVLHIHLGPGNKLMEVWPATHPQFKGKRRVLGSIERFFGSGVAYKIEPGDAFFLPAGSLYHIGRNSGLSLSLTISISNSHVNRKKAIKKLVVKQRTMPKPASHQNLGPDLQEIIDDQCFKNMSNHFIRSCIDVHELKIRDVSGKLKIVNPFRIYTRRIKEGHDRIYARGYQLKTNATPLTLSLIRELNSNRTVDIDKLKATLNGQKELQRLTDTVIELLEVRAIDFVT
ncbi:MAG: hypothetical protein KTR16_01700 [Acidiferrobacterales bacterium]|nr:hypothetical protein [Acidiferrobacterales bacterium]